MKTIVTLTMALLVACTALSQPVTLNWAHQVGSTALDDAADTQSDSEGNVYVIGTFTGNVDFDPSGMLNVQSGPGIRNGYICKYGPAGNLLWVRIQTVNAGERMMPRSLAIDDAGNVFVTGYFNGTADFHLSQGGGIVTAPTDRFESFVLKLDGQGTVSWVRHFGTYDGVDGATAITVDPGGNLIVTGVFDDDSDFDTGPGTHILSAPGFHSTFILKWTGTGDFIWAKQLDAGPAYVYAFTVDTDNEGNSVIGGAFAGTADLDPGAGTHPVTSMNGNDGYILKLGPQGEYIWAHVISGPMPESIETIDVGNSGTIYATGIFSSEATDFDDGPGIAELPFNGITDIFMLKMSANGDLGWYKAIGAEDYDAPKTVVVDNAENLYIGGRFRVTVDFDPGSGIFNMSSVGPGGDETFVAKFNTGGEFVWAIELNGNTNNCNGIAFAPGAGLYVVGTFQNPTDFDPGVGMYQMTSPGGWPDGYIMRIDMESGAALPEMSQGLLNCSPNPLTEIMTVTFGNASGNARIAVIDDLGRTVLEQTDITGGIVELNTASLAAGPYIVRLQDGIRTAHTKVIK